MTTCSTDLSFAAFVAAAASASSASNSTIGHDNAQGRQGLFEDRELRQQITRHACARFVAAPEPIAE